MGHIFSNQGLKIDPDKVNAVLKMPRHKDVEGVQRLNGFVNYLAKFLPRLADHMEPIRRLTRQDTEFSWTEEQDAYREVKRLVTTAPVLSYYDPKAELKIQCDASTPAEWEADCIHEQSTHGHRAALRTNRERDARDRFRTREV